jgi:hypothetical protein
LKSNFDHMKKMIENQLAGWKMPAIYQPDSIFQMGCR